MSMLTMQIDELRKAARNIQGNLGRCCYRRKDVNEMQQVGDMLSEAANTIESLRGRLQAAELGNGACEDVGSAATFKCSECGWYSPVFTFGEGMPRFCPQCGKAVER